MEGLSEGDGSFEIRAHSPVRGAATVGPRSPPVLPPMLPFSLPASPPLFLPYIPPPPLRLPSRNQRLYSPLPFFLLSSPCTSSSNLPLHPVAPTLLAFCSVKQSPCPPKFHHSVHGIFVIDAEAKNEALLVGEAPFSLSPSRCPSPESLPAFADHRDWNWVIDRPNDGLRRPRHARLCWGR